MILIFGPSPDESANTGVNQRALGIDYLFKNRKRIYVKFTTNPLEYSFKAPIKNNSNLLKLSLNPDNCRHSQILLDFLLISELIYSHSIFGLEPIANLVTNTDVKSNLVIDMHGVVPEECLLQGKPLDAKKYNLLEEALIQRSALLVMVSKKMQQHFLSKYPHLTFNSVVIPIFQQNMQISEPLPQGLKPCIIYAGGVEQWQNVEKMLQSVEQLSSRFNFHFYSLFSNELLEQVTQKGLNAVIQLGTLTKTQEMQMKYREAQYGFILRDNSIVNQVACPTKLIDYLCAGIIPVVLSPEIGDFNDLGYHYILLEDLAKGNLPDDIQRFQMIKTNHAIAEELSKNVPSLFENVTHLIQSQPIKKDQLIERLISRNETLLNLEQSANEAVKKAELKAIEAETRALELKILREKQIKYRTYQFARKLKHNTKKILSNLKSRYS